MLIRLMIWKESPYLRFMVLLVGLVAVIFGTCASDPLDNCDYDDKSSKVVNEYTSEKPFGQATIFRKTDDSDLKPGAWTSRYIQSENLKQLDSSTVTYTWTPPKGSTNFSFPGDHTPDPDGPPFIFRDIPVGKSVEVNFNVPELPPDQNKTIVHETVRADYSDGTTSMAAMDTKLVRNDRLNVGYETPHQSPSIQPATKQQEFVSLWDIELWTDQVDIPLTTSLCQDWRDFLQSDEVFLALRVPISPTNTISKSFPLPIYWDNQNPSTISIEEYGLWGTTVISMPLEIRTERLSFAQENLPAAEGEFWLTLGAGESGATCPDGLDIPKNDWGLLSKIKLDFSFMSDYCEDCVLEQYYCYQGEEQPVIPGKNLPGTFLTDLSLSLLGKEQILIQEDGITCIGPRVIQVTPWPGRLLVGNSTTLRRDPGEVLQLYHTIYSFTGITTTIRYTDTIGTGWTLYPGTELEPDLSAPLALPVTIPPGKTTIFWMVSDPVPLDTPPGPYDLRLAVTSVTSPVIKGVASDIFWIGDWVLPGSVNRIFLPMVNK